MYFRIKPRNSTLYIRSYSKLAPQYYEPFEVLEQVGTVGYKLDIPCHVIFNNVFHVLLLKKYVHDPSHMVDSTLIQVEIEGDCLPEPLCIVGREETMLWNRILAR